MKFVEAHLPQGEDAVKRFPEPWAAEAFALTVHLLETGVLKGNDWADLLGSELNSGPWSDGERGYYEAWVSALAKVLLSKGLATSEELDALQASWQRAAAATPHGVAISLSNDPLSSN